MARSRTSRPAPGAAAALAALALLASPAAAGEDASLLFASDGKLVARHDLSWLRGLGPREVTVFEPYEAREVRFEAVRFADVLDAVYGEAWRGREELLFSCRDGYQPTLPVRRVLEHEAWLAFDRADEEGFAIWKRESGRRQRIELAPFYLIWENLEDARIRLEHDYGWPYQLVAIDLIDARDRFPAMAPPEGAPARVRAGFEAFRIHCGKCHRLNGEGGTVGPELNDAVSPVEYRRREWLRMWIDDPSRIAPDARMPPLNPDLPDRQATIDAILAYLEAMAQARRAAGAPGGD